MLFSKPRLVLWPKTNSTEFYLDQKENNLISFDFSLWSKLSSADISSVNTFLKQYSPESITILVPDDIVFTKSFIYDTQITSIEKNEVISLAESFVHFKIEPDLLDYNLIQSNEKTIIQARIYEPTKTNKLRTNLSDLQIKTFTLTPVSAAISRVLGQISFGEYFLLYPLNNLEYTLILSQKDSVFLTSNHKSSSLEIQKIINYSNLYFSSPTAKLYLPQGKDLDIISTTVLEKTPFNESQIALDLKKPSNVPLPVLGVINHSLKMTAIINKTDISSNPKTPMENKKNVLPLVAVFVVTAAIASVIIWFIMNRSSDSSIQNPSSENQNPTPTVEVPPTDIPTPTLGEIDKTLKIQVLNSTDINGQAASLKSKISLLGFKNITVGNSTAKTSESLIRVKAGQEAVGNYFVSSLKGYFDAITVSDILATSSYDVIMVIGQPLTGAVTPETTVPVLKITPTKVASPSAKPSSAVIPTP